MSWPLCEHGYYITPSHKCPWCFGGDTSKYRFHVGTGNGWLLGIDDRACEGCGGPSSAGWGAWARPEPPTPELVKEVMATIAYCYTCTSAGKREVRTWQKGERVSPFEQKLLDANTCPDCGKRFVVAGICPRLTCGSRFDGSVRANDAEPDLPDEKVVQISWDGNGNAVEKVVMRKPRRMQS